MHNDPCKWFRLVAVGDGRGYSCALQRTCFWHVGYSAWALCLALSSCGRWDPVVTRTTFTASDVKALESGFRVTFPSSTRVIRASLLKGKDATLYAEIEISVGEVDALKAGIQFAYEARGNHYITEGSAAVPWYKLREDRVAEILESDDLTSLVISTAVERKVSVYLETSNALRRMPPEVYKVFVQK